MSITFSDKKLIDRLLSGKDSQGVEMQQASYNTFLNKLSKGVTRDDVVIYVGSCAKYQENNEEGLAFLKNAKQLFDAMGRKEKLKSFEDFKILADKIRLQAALKYFSSYVDFAAYRPLLWTEEDGELHEAVIEGLKSMLEVKGGYIDLSDLDKAKLLVTTMLKNEPDDQQLLLKKLSSQFDQLEESVRKRDEIKEGILTLESERKKAGKETPKGLSITEELNKKRQVLDGIKEKMPAQLKEIKVLLYNKKKVLADEASSTPRKVRTLLAKTERDEAKPTRKKPKT